MKKIFLAALLVSFGNLAFAQGFFGIGVGQATVDIDAVPIGSVVPTVDDTDTSFKIFGGAMFNPNLGLEIGYTNFGEGSARWDDGFDYINDKYEASAFYIAGLGVVPITERVGFFGKIGLASWDLDVSETSSIPGINYSASESGMDLMFGIGAQLDVNNMLLRLEFERFSDVGDADTTGQSDVDVVGLSAAFKF